MSRHIDKMLSTYFKKSNIKEEISILNQRQKDLKKELRLILEIIEELEGVKKKVS